MSRWAYARRRDMHAPSVGRGEHRQPRADLATSPTGLRVGFEGAKQPISRVVLRWEAAYGKDYSIQVSNDGKTWTTVRHVTNGKGGITDLTFTQRAAR